jgi:ribonuclease HI
MPKITYAADVWFTPIHRPPGAKVQRGSVAAFNKLTKAQRIAAIAITGCLKTTATDYVEPHANLMPLDLLIKDLCLRAFTRLVSLKGNHPLVEVVRKATHKPAKRHLSPIDILHALTGLKQGDIAPIILPVIEDYTRDAFKCIIPKDRETSIRMEEADQATVKVYTDGSAMEAGVGASAVVVDTTTGRTQVRKYHLGKTTDHIGYEAEVIGLTLAIHQIAELPHRGATSIYTDNQAGLKAINTPPDGAAGYLIQNIVKQMKDLRERRPIFARNITFRWISAHSGVPGNELADREAKRAAEGHSSRRNLLPTLLRKPLPKSATAVKRVFREKIVAEWTARRNTSKRKGRMDLIDPSFTPSGFQKLIKSFNRNDSTLLNRLRSNHAPLNTFLHRIKRADDPTCPECGQADETIRHFLFECQAFRELRRDTLDGLGRDSRNTSFLLSTKKGAEALLRYAKGTKRLEPDRLGAGGRAGVG